MIGPKSAAVKGRKTRPVVERSTTKVGSPNPRTRRDDADDKQWSFAYKAFYNQFVMTKRLGTLSIRTVNITEVPALLIEVIINKLILKINPVYCYLIQ